MSVHSSGNRLRRDCTALTEVKMTWIEGRYEQSLRFGRAAVRKVLTRHKSIAGFRHGTVFALVRRISSDFGTAKASIDIVMAVASGAPCSALPSVHPGGDVLLHAETLPNVARVLESIDMVEAAGIDPCDASPDHWRHVGSRLDAGLSIRPYTTARHAQWLRRKAIEP